ncbi:MAG: FKBP-type peptidyl-prolyl cis-trans isomerase [Mucilaginibacter sp.]|nr:FKBP-type peptidyl-prolyl cis-trans isomerase [Mucilaginibacter sp.]
MKKCLLILSVVVIAFASCKKIEDFDPVKQAAEDDAAIKKYINVTNASAVKDSTSSLYYTIINPGTGPRPNINSTVTVTYVGKTIGGSVFDQSTTDAAFLLNRLILGWQIGLPKIGTGGEIILYVPSALGYGNVSAGPLGPNTVLIFDIKLSGIN